VLAAWIARVHPASTLSNDDSCAEGNWWDTLRDAAGTGQVTIGDVLAVVDRLQQMPEAVTGRHP
jgi:hypothetical protein